MLCLMCWGFLGICGLSLFLISLPYSLLSPSLVHSVTVSSFFSLIYPTVLHLCSLILDSQPFFTFTLSFLYFCLSSCSASYFLSLSSLSRPLWVVCSLFEEQCSGQGCECLSNPLATCHRTCLCGVGFKRTPTQTHLHTQTYAKLPSHKIFQILKHRYVLTEHAHVLAHAPSNLLTLSHWKHPPTYKNTHRV